MTVKCLPGQFGLKLTVVFEPAMKHTSTLQYNTRVLNHDTLTLIKLSLESRNILEENLNVTICGANSPIVDLMSISNYSYPIFLI